MHLGTDAGLHLPAAQVQLAKLTGMFAEAARAAYKAGTVRCMDSLPLWRARALLEERAGAPGKARALLEQVLPLPLQLLCCRVSAATAA